jgi:fatty aldehyde-generating acyl-ACP reductase
MDHQPARVRFGAIGHQDSWDTVERFVQVIRAQADLPTLRLEQIREVYGFIPPRALFDVAVESEQTGSCSGIYIDTFIAPDELDAGHLSVNVAKVREACQYAAELQIPVVSLGGFTSIVLENSGQPLTRLKDTYFTTGNTLTAGFIIQGIEKACAYWQQVVAESTVLIIGSTGDIGAACTAYYAQKAQKLILCARHAGRLQRQAATVAAPMRNVRWSTTINECLPEADIVICVASSLLETCDLSLLPPHAIICDAGYPKNIADSFSTPTRRIFSGGMGIVEKGYHVQPAYAQEICQFPLPNIAHGCLLEAVVLAMNNSPQSWSVGRGNITLDRIESILQMAAAHGVTSAPLFAPHRVWEQHPLLTAS